MEMESNIKIVPTSKQAISAMAADIIKKVDDGEDNPLDVFVKIKALEEALKIVKTQIEERAVNEAEKYGKGVFNHLGTSITIRETGVKYDFTNVSSWNAIQDKIDELKEQQKVIETMAKAATIDHPYVDANTGEVVTGIGRTSKTSVVISFK